MIIQFLPELKCFNTQNLILIAKEMVIKIIEIIKLLKQKLKFSI
jgi:hypothetical protein